MKEYQFWLYAALAWARKINRGKQIKMRYIVEIFSIEDNGWIVWSRHNNEKWAIVNAEVKDKEGTKTRIIHEGKIIWEGKT